MGDSGSYVISLFVGFTLINVYNNSVSISPFFIALLLWYPCFENLFSIIRKFNFKLSPLKPDNKHLHHLIYINLKRKYKLSKNLSNNISSMIINFFNLIILLIGSLNTHHTLTQLLLIVLIIIIYTKTYLTLLKKYSTSRI